jgi:hypothetical protein
MDDVEVPEETVEPVVEEPRPEVREDEDDGSGPSSHETSGPGGEADPRDDPEDGPSSHETSGTDPAAEVAATHETGE